MVARYGGEEFGIILSACDIPAASQVIQKISRAVEKIVFTTPKGNFNITLSAGICSNKERNLFRVGDMIRFADEALYRAKAEGRNRTCIYQPPLKAFIYQRA